MTASVNAATGRRPLRFDCVSATDRAALALARGVARASNAWGQRGLGTMFLLLGRRWPFGKPRCVVEYAPGASFQTDVFEPYWGPTLIGGRAYEPEVLAVLQALRGLGATLVDCGANFGFWSVLASSPGFGYSRVVAIEPNPATLIGLRANEALNAGRFTVVPKAVSARSGETVHLAAAEHHAVAHVAPAGHGGVAVETVTIDDALESLGWLSLPAPILVKLDVEGHELDALAGMTRVREKPHAIVFEDFATKGFENLRGFLARGYAIHYVTQRGGCCSVASLDDALRVVALAGKARRSNNFLAVDRRWRDASVLLARWVEGSRPAR